MTQTKRLKPKFKVFGMVCTTLQLILSLVCMMLVYYSDAFTNMYKYMVYGTLMLLCLNAWLIMKKNEQDLSYLVGLLLSIVEIGWVIVIIRALLQV